MIYEDGLGKTHVYIKHLSLNHGEGRIKVIRLVSNSDKVIL